MPRYCVNNVSQFGSRDHEVHRAGCVYWPVNRTDLGEHATCHAAVAAAKRIYPDSNGCYFCSYECHTT